MFPSTNVLTKAMTIDEASIIESVVGLLWGKQLRRPRLTIDFPQ